jgi:hypothetical protein
MRRQFRRRFWVEITLGIAAVGLFFATLASPDWIEDVFGLNIDGGSGSLEWALALGTGVVALAMIGATSYEFRRTAIRTFQ